MVRGSVKIIAQNYLQAPAERSQPAIEASSKAVSRCFIFMYFLLPHWVPATWRSRAQTSIRAELPSGNAPTTRVRRRISRFSRSITLLVRIRLDQRLNLLIRRTIAEKAIQLICIDVRFYFHRFPHFQLP